ncbi:epithelial-stromal interaction protein 1 isoform 1-T1 [Leptodactylus fuscus]|uniref:epithelial-stromal interaction protein 1 n=1 Tax=Leptodactylus fuscus TaxID=238119 RepID=UPI003F4EACB7
MYGQNVYGGGRSGSRMQNNQSQRNTNYGDNFSTRMRQQQDADAHQDNINVQPAPQPTQEPQYSGPCQVFQPDPAKREKLLAQARKGEEDYERLKESRRSGSIHLTPRKLGGQISESEARHQQQQIQAQSKYQKMQKREEYKRKQKEEEEAKIQKMKDMQRKKAEKLEERRQQQDLERREKWDEQRFRCNDEFLDRLQPVSHPDDRVFERPNEWVDDDDQYDWKPEQDWKLSHETAVNQEQDEDWMLQQALKNSLLTFKTEEETRLKEDKKPQQKQSNWHTYRQQQKEEEEKKLKEMKDNQRQKAEGLKQREEERTLTLEEERRRANNAFLDRLQRQNTSQHGYSGESNAWA